MEYAEYLSEHFPLSGLLETFEAHSVEGALAFLDVLDGLVELLFLPSLSQDCVVGLIDTLELVGSV